MPLQCAQSPNKGASSDSPINWNPKSRIRGSILSGDTWSHDGLEHEDKNEACYSSDSDDDYYVYSCDNDDDGGGDDDSGGDKEDDYSSTLHLVLRDRRALGPPPGFEEIDRKVPLLNNLLKLEPIDHEVELTEKDVRPRLITGSPAVCKSRAMRGERRDK